jgi:3-methyladenine DNA glycosylase AlkD
MFKLSKKAQKLFLDTVNSGLLDDSNFDNPIIYEKWQTIAAKFYGEDMIDSTSHAWEVVDMLNGRKVITAFFNDDSQYFLYYCSEEKLLEKMKKWQAQLIKLAY